MILNEVLKDRKISMYRLAKSSGIPYATINDICSGKSRLERCSAETVYRIAHTLDISMEDLLAPYMVKRSSFENFKSSICHRVKEMGDIDFIIDTLESREIQTYFDRKWYPESLYLLAMLDYISRENELPLCSEYDDLRRCKLEKPVYPASVLALALSSKDDTAMKEAEKRAIPEFLRFNIIEGEVRNIV